MEREIINQEAYDELMTLNEEVKKSIAKKKLPNDLFTGIKLINSEYFLKNVLKKREGSFRRAINLSDHIGGWEIDIDWHATISLAEYSEGFSGRFNLCFVDFGLRALISDMSEVGDGDGYLYSEDRDFLRKLEQVVERAHQELRFITEFNCETEAEFLTAISSTIYTAKEQLLELFGEITKKPYDKQQEQNKTVINLIQTAFGDLPYIINQVRRSDSLADVNFGKYDEDEDEDEDFEDFYDEVMMKVW